jgi:hypothetical protein
MTLKASLGELVALAAILFAGSPAGGRTATPSRVPAGPLRIRARMAASSVSSSLAGNFRHLRAGR